VFVSIKGSPRRWFEASLKSGDLAGVRSAAAELPQISLADALAIVMLMAADGDRAFERAAVRWLGRLALERPGVGLDDLAAVLSALQTLGGATTASSQLARVCARHGVDDVIGLPVRADAPAHRSQSARVRR
jgi:hypothetical protein